MNELIETENVARLARYQIEIKCDTPMSASVITTRRVITDALAEVGIDAPVWCSIWSNEQKENVGVVDLKTSQIGLIEPALSIRREIAGWTLRILEF